MCSVPGEACIGRKCVACQFGVGPNGTWQILGVKADCPTDQDVMYYAQLWANQAPAGEMRVECACANTVQNPGKSCAQCGDECQEALQIYHGALAKAKP